MSDDQRTDASSEPTPDDIPLVQVFSTAEASEGMAAKGRLESEGISVFIKGQATDQAYPTGGTFLFVREDDEAKAREILDEAAEGELEDLVEPDAPDAG